MVYCIALILLIHSVFSLQAQAQDTLTVLTHNVLAFSGHPTKVHTTDSIVFTKGVDYYKQTEADIIVLQESPDISNVKKMAHALGFNYAFFSPKYSGSDIFPYGFPGCIITRYPIVQAWDYNRILGEIPDSLFQRHLGQVILQTPSGYIEVVGLHLCADWGGVHRESTRIEELEVLLNHVSFCDTCIMSILAGDFNSTPESPPYKKVISAGYRDTQIADGTPTVPIPEAKVRIDYIFIKSKTKVQFETLPLKLPYYKDLNKYLSDHNPCMVQFITDRINK